MPSSAYIDLKTKRKGVFPSLRAKRGNLAETKCRPRTRHQPIVHQNRPVIASKGVAVAWRSPGREALLAYTDKKTFPWGISPLRSDCRPHSGRNDIIKPNAHRCHSGASVEKSPAIETETLVPDFPKHLPAGAPCRANPLARAGSSPRRKTLDSSVGGWYN